MPVSWPKRAFLVPLAVLSSLLAGAPARAQTSPPASSIITGESADDDFGWRVAPAGDVNGDGALDLIVGAPSNDAVAGFAGRAYLFHGPITGDLNAANADAIDLGRGLRRQPGLLGRLGGRRERRRLRRRAHRGAQQRHARHPGRPRLSLPRAVQREPPGHVRGRRSSPGTTSRRWGARSLPRATSTATASTTSCSGTGLGGAFGRGAGLRLLRADQRPATRPPARTPSSTGPSPTSRWGPRWLRRETSTATASPTSWSARRASRWAATAPAAPTSSTGPSRE